MIGIKNTSKKIAKMILRPFKPTIVRTHLYQKYVYKQSLTWLASRNLKKKAASRFVFYNKNKVEQYCELFKKIKIISSKNERFQYWIDEDLHFFNKYEMTDALPPNFELVLQNSIEDLLKQNSSKNNEVQRNNYMLLLEIKSYIERILEQFSSVNAWKNNRTISYFNRMLTGRAESLEEALQRVLFWSSIFWQTGHTHVGLGRLDKILEPFASLLPEKETVGLIKDFILTLHSHWAFKSASLLGDTGQIIILGGTEINGDYFCNRLTYCFIEALEELRLPEPKILLRVSKKTPDGLIAIAIQLELAVHFLQMTML